VAMGFDDHMVNFIAS